MRRALRIAFVVLLVGAELGAVAILHRLGRVAGFAPPHHAIVRWVLHAPTEDLFGVAARLAGLALAWWLLAATMLSIARRVVPAWRRLHTLDCVTPAAMRHALDRALALGLGASLAMASVRPAGASAVDQPVVRSPDPSAATAATTGSPTSPRAPQPVAAPGARVVVVRAGDNLWVIAQRALRPGSREAEARAVDAAEVVPYWRRIIAANAATLRSHDPNLIFPGERVVLPTIVAEPGSNGGGPAG
jgi:nucleoid-associated protein YgaU